MDKKLFSLLTLGFFIGINTQPSTDAARKINGILNKMGVTTTAESKQQYIEVTPDARSIDTYNANHECIDSKKISPHIKNILNNKNLDGAGQEEATFAGYRLGTKLKMEQTPKKWVKTMKFNLHNGLRIVGSIIVMGSINKSIGQREIFSTKTLLAMGLQLGMANLIDDKAKTYIDSYYKKQNEKELNKQTFYNLGLHTNKNYSCLFEKMKSPDFKKAFEEGRKAQQGSSQN